MKILLINSFLYNRGGDCTYMFSLGELLNSKGHEVFYWGMKHPLNYSFKYQESFVDYIDYVDLNKKKSIVSGYKVLTRSIYSIKARNKLKKFIEEICPDIVHINNIHAHLTPSILDTIHQKGISIVWTLHDFKLLCPESHFLSHDVVCEKCKGNKFYNCLLNKCKKGSFSASLIATVEAYVHQSLLLTDKVNIFIAPSLFMREKFIEYGMNSAQIVFLRNFLILNNKIREEIQSNYILFFGGLSLWKGVGTLIAAMKQAEHPYVLKIVGDGESRAELESQVMKFGLKNIEFYGKKMGDELVNIVKNSMFVVVPSECYENCPYSVMEAMSYGRPVIGSDIGGIPELVQDGVTGLLFQPGNADDLANKINWLIEHPDKLTEFSRNAFEFSRRECNSTKYYKSLISHYKRITTLRKFEL